MLESLGQRSSFTRIKNARGFDLGLLFLQGRMGFDSPQGHIIHLKERRSSMQRIRKPLPVSLRRIIIERDRNQRSLAKRRSLDFHFSACTRAVRVHNRWTGECLGNAYFNGEEFYFSQQMMKYINRVGHEDYYEVQNAISGFLNDCLLVGGFR